MGRRQTRLLSPVGRLLQSRTREIRLDVRYFLVSGLRESRTYQHHDNHSRSLVVQGIRHRPSALASHGDRCQIWLSARGYRNRRGCACMAEKPQFLASATLSAITHTCFFRAKAKAIGSAVRYPNSEIPTTIANSASRKTAVPRTPSGTASSPILLRSSTIAGAGHCSLSWQRGVIVRQRAWCRLCQQSRRPGRSSRALEALDRSSRRTRDRRHGARQLRRR